MSIQVNGNAAAINWESLLQQIGDLSKTAETGEKPALTFTTTAADGSARTVTVQIPDDLEFPATVDQNAIDSLCAKLAADTELGVDAAQIERLRGGLTSALEASGVPESVASLSRSKSVMFDLYKLMALLVEVAQKQRDATRELRAAESQQIQTSIQAQAEKQHNAAVTSMIASGLCCLVQVGAMAFSLVKQANAFKTQLATLETSGVGSARQNLAMLKAGESAQGAQQQLQSARAAVGETTANRIDDAFIEADVAKGHVQAREIQLQDNAARLQRLQNVQQPLRREDIPQGSNLERAQQRLDSFHDYKALQANPHRTAAETTRMMNYGSQFDNVTEQQLVDEINAARPEAATQFQQTVRANENELNGLRKTANAKLDSTLKTFEDAYDTAVRQRADVTPETSKAEIARLDGNLQTASNDLRYARAYAANERIATTTANERQLLTAQAEARLGDAQTLLRGDTSYIKAGQVIQRGEGVNALINSVGNCVQNIIQNSNAMMQAEATKIGAQQQQQREELEQMKDLFSQAGELVEAVVNLMKAISSAETQSMHDAIQV